MTQGVSILNLLVNLGVLIQDPREQHHDQLRTQNKYGGLLLVLPPLQIGQNL